MEKKKCYNVKVTNAKNFLGEEEKEYYFNLSDPWKAVCYAQGWVEAYEWHIGHTMFRPAVQELDGWWWQERKHGGLRVEVVDEEGNLFFTNLK